MNNRKGSNYMEKAIDKASRLIELLTKENSELKEDNINLQAQFDSLANQSQSAVLEKEELRNKNKNLMKEFESIGEEKRRLKEELKSVEEKYEERIATNKQLHEKLGEFATRNQSLNKSLELEKKRNLSLQNENEYLVKTFSKHEEKENQFQNYCYLTEEEFKKEIITIDRTKQAFARKCEELKSENSEIIKETLILKERIKALEEEQKILFEYKQKCLEIERESRKTGDTLSYIIESCLKVKPEPGLYSKVEQIKNYISFRMQHIENLVKPIAEILEKEESHSKEVKNLEDLNCMVSRLGLYLGELLK